MVSESDKTLHAYEQFFEVKFCLFIMTKTFGSLNYRMKETKLKKMKLYFRDQMMENKYF